MNVEYFPYEIQSPWHGSGHAGALIRVEVQKDLFGYADLHPWPELGDPDLSVCLKALMNNHPILPMVMRMSKLAMWDAEARARGHSLGRGCEVPRSHRLVEDLGRLSAPHLEAWAGEGYTHVKVKLGQDLTAETDHLRRLVNTVAMRWRIDFNGRLSASEFGAWWAAHENWLSAHVDGFEDPAKEGSIPQSHLPVYWDRIIPASDNGQGLVWKPEVGEEPERSKWAKLWITSNLGHPFGHAVAMILAARAGHQEIAGLQGLQAYRSDEWTESIRYHGPSSLPPSGTGFGFDRLLARLRWRKLV